jgi:hypothetical protein
VELEYSVYLLLSSEKHAAEDGFRFTSCLFIGIDVLLVCVIDPEGNFKRQWRLQRFVLSGLGCTKNIQGACRILIGMFEAGFVAALVF